MEFLDRGTQGLVLDAVALGAEPGTVHVLRGWKHEGERASTAHESNVGELLQASTLLGECPEQVTVIGIEPTRIETGIGVSEAVAPAVTEAVEAARRELGGARVWFGKGAPDLNHQCCSLKGVASRRFRISAAGMRGDA